jgi:hypothetical protein
MGSWITAPRSKSEGQGAPTPSPAPTSVRPAKENTKKNPAVEANALIDGKHYIGAVAFTPTFCLSTPQRDAVAIYGPPVAASFKGVLELRRLWQADGCKRQVSEFLSATLRWLRKSSPDVPFVVSYADPAAGHRGTVYKAANFKFLRMARATDTWLTRHGTKLSAAKVYRMLKTKSRKAIKAARPHWRLVPGQRKLLFVYPMAQSLEAFQRRQRGRLFTSGGGFRNEVYQEKFPALVCAYCRRKFLAKRADAQTCSPSCRVMLHRKRTRA